MPVGTLGQADLTVAGRAFYVNGDTKYGANPTFKQLYTYHQGNGTSTFHEQGSSTGYAPGASRKFIMLALIVTPTMTTASNGVTGTPLYSDNDLGDGAGGAPTNPVYLANGGTATGLVSLANLTGENFEIPLNFEVIATKYAGIAHGSNANITYQCLGYEVDA